MIKMVITLKRREGMTHDEFRHYQQNIHRPMLMSIPESERYIRRFVVSKNFIDLSTFGRIICEEDVVIDRN
ncbi:EthD domain-containing protein [Nonomuraea sp. ZG12]|uniref:EthD domain-containing protein n=1 Tax=Nonomuraea sp. ZG12 TaxID=3452207 RepID=UPI003F8878AD